MMMKICDDRVVATGPLEVAVALALEALSASIEQIS
jgi:hypothetical protein